MVGPFLARTIDLIEQMDCWLDRHALTIEEALAIGSFDGLRMDVGWPTPANGNRWRLRPRGWVGTVSVANSLTLRIAPKIALDRLFGLLLWANGLGSIRIFDGLSRTGSVDGSFAIVLEELARRVARRVARGLRKEYVSRIQWGPTPHGRIRFRDSVRQFAAGRPTMVWEESPLTVDNLDNQLVAWALVRAARSSLSSVTTARELVRLDRLFSSWTTPRRFAVSDYVRRVSSPADEDYAAIHALCAFVLLMSDPAPTAGETPFLSYGIDIPTVFEDAVARLLAASAAPGISVRRKPTIGIGAGMRFEPDIVIFGDDRRARVVIDTKYKSSIEQQDARQAIAYATALGCGEAILVYPGGVGGDHMHAGDVRVRCLDFYVDREPVAEADRLLRSILHDPRRHELAG